MSFQDYENGPTPCLFQMLLEVTIEQLCRFVFCVSLSSQFVVLFVFRSMHYRGTNAVQQ